MDGGGDLVGDIRTLGKADDGAAKVLLKRIVGHVLPIMRKRQWKAGRVCEFFPANPNLLGLNVNRGEEIRIRLRPADRETGFLPFESLVGTMLHELTHIVRGPHDAQFYKILDELTSEYEINLTKGLVEAEGFIGAGVTLGGRAAPPPENLRTAAAQAAEQRRQASVLLGQVPQTVGGRSGGVWLKKPPGLMAAEAAERRLLDSIWCGNHDDDPPAAGAAGPSKPLAAALPAAKPPATKRARTGSEAGAASAPAQTAPAVPDGARWSCPVCTYVNQALWLQCDICQTVRPL